MIIGHGGNIYKLAARLGCAPGEIIDMSSNVNPLGTMPGLVTFLKDNIQAIGRLLILFFSDWHFTYSFCWNKYIYTRANSSGRRK